MVDYEAQGFLPEAFFNFLTLLGWSPDTDQELFTKDELVRAFDLGQVVSHAAIFDIEKLKWMNLQYIKQLPGEELFRRCEPFLTALPGYPGGFDRPQLVELAGLFRERMNVLTEIADKASYFFQAPGDLRREGAQDRPEDAGAGGGDGRPGRRAGRPGAVRPRRRRAEPSGRWRRRGAWAPAR